MKPLLECVPNFSEGRRSEIVDAIVGEVESFPGVSLLDRHSDADHNRTVLSLAGDPGAVSEATFRAVARATELIDLRAHTGEHPRLGATDVVPFIPLGGLPMQGAVNVAHQFGERVARELDIPVYFYEEAALVEGRRNLENVRRKGFEELRDVIAVDPDRSPDQGPVRVHETAGACVVGARGPLIAYNIYLNTSEVRVAKAIARTVRHSSGGLRFVKALGLDIPARNQVQVSMNLTNYQKSSIPTVFNLVESEARRYGVSIAASEVVGLVPLEALLDSARHYLRLDDFSDEQVLETRLMG